MKLYMASTLKSRVTNYTPITIIHLSFESIVISIDPITYNILL